MRSKTYTLTVNRIALKYGTPCIYLVMDRTFFGREWRCVLGLN